MSDGQRRRWGLLAVGLLLLALVVLGPIVASTFESDRAAQGDAEAFAEARAEGRAHTVSPHPNSSMAIWPYTSRSKSVEGATLPINVVVLADVELVRTTLVHRPNAEWEDQRQGLNGTASSTNASAEDRTPTPNATGRTPAGTVTEGTPNSSVAPATPSPGGTADASNSSARGTTSVPAGTTPTPNASVDAGTATSNETTTAPGDGRENPLLPTSINSTGVYWSDASGSNRYTYVTSGEPGGGRWIDEAGQLHDGDYFGARYHIRFYEVSDGETSWTALQVHREHFDWFRLRHTVGSLPRAQHYVETQFYDQWYISDLHRERFTRGGILNSDGWVTVVDIKYPHLLRRSIGISSLVAGLVVGSVIGGWTSPIDRRDVRRVTETIPFDLQFALMAAAVAAIPLFVRAGSLAVERARVVNNPDVIAAAFYPLLAVGLPVSGYVLARDLDPQEAFSAAAGGFGIGVLGDYAYLGITVLPIEVIVHRAVLLLALGIVAAAGTEPPEGSRVDVRDPTLLAGVGLWVAGLLWTLFFW